jgi:hypothetical protein
MKETGTVKGFNAAKGFGFIQRGRELMRCVNPVPVPHADRPKGYGRPFKAQLESLPAGIRA